MYYGYVPSKPEFARQLLLVVQVRFSNRSRDLSTPLSAQHHERHLNLGYSYFSSSIKSFSSYSPKYPATRATRSAAQYYFRIYCIAERINTTTEIKAGGSPSRQKDRCARQSGKYQTGERNAASNRIEVNHETTLPLPYVCASGGIRAGAIPAPSPQPPSGVPSPRPPK